MNLRHKLKLLLSMYLSLIVRSRNIYGKTQINYIRNISLFCNIFSNLSAYKFFFGVQIFILKS